MNDEDPHSRTCRRLLCHPLHAEFYAAVAWLVASAAERFRDAVQSPNGFPSLKGTSEISSRREIARLDAGEAADWWQDAVGRWRRGRGFPVPSAIRRRRASTIGLCCCCLRSGSSTKVPASASCSRALGLLLQSRQPTMGVLTELWSVRGEGCPTYVRTSAQLRALGLLQWPTRRPLGRSGPSGSPALVWDAIRGDGSDGAGCGALSTAGRVAGHELLHPSGSTESAGGGPAGLLRSGDSRALVLPVPGTTDGTPCSGR